MLETILAAIVAFTVSLLVGLIAAKIGGSSDL